MAVFQQITAARALNYDRNIGFQGNGFRRKKSNDISRKFRSFPTLKPCNGFF
jgi:hypothetical protein